MAANSQSPTKQEVTALLVGWRKLELARAAARLRVERGALRSAKNTSQLIVSRAADSLEGLANAPRLTKMTAIAAIQRGSAQLRDASAADIADARSDAREASLKRAVAEIDHLSALLSDDGWPSDQLPDAPTADTEDTDGIRSAAAGSSISARWSALALAALSKWESDSGLSLPYQLRRTVALLEPHLERTIATEISHAWADEHSAALEPLSDYPWSAQVFRVWSAMLDGSVCQRCYEMDGTAVPVDNVWPGGAYQPMHPYCRCMEVPLYIPKPKALQDVASDYSAYKAEVRDQVRASRHSKAAGRHSAAFIERSRAGRSPIVISKDFAVGRLARRTGT